MKKTTITIVPLLAAMLLAACEKEIHIDLEDQQPLVVAHSFVEAGKPASVVLTLSSPIFGYHSNDYYSATEFTPVTDATATLVVNGSSTYTAQRDGNNYTFAYTAQVGDQLQLKLQAPGYDDMEATTTVPVPARVDPASVSLVLADNDADEWWLDSDVLKFELQDPADEENYYSFRVLVRKYYEPVFSPSGELVGCADSSVRYMTYGSDDPLLLDASISTIFNDFYDDYVDSRELFVSDSRFNGATHTFKFDLYSSGLYSNDHVETRLDFQVVTYSRDEFNYRLGFSESNDVDEVLEFFSEPRQVYSNIEGGAGVFGAHTVLSFNVPIERRF